MNPAEHTAELLERLRAGERAAVGDLFELHRERLWRMLFIRLDRRVARRVSADDVLQEAFFDISNRIDEYLEQSAVPFYVWLRFLTLQRLRMIQRAHLGARMRSVSQEVSLAGDGVALASSDSIAGQLVSHMTSPSQAVMRRELRDKLRAALDEMDPLDREVLALRHFEELSNSEVAEILRISKDAASKRHVRALIRLRGILTESAGPFPV
jgi:RNA polymerase sigma-70 factor (ECF subfamily)